MFYSNRRNSGGSGGGVIGNNAGDCCIDLCVPVAPKYKTKKTVVLCILGLIIYTFLISVINISILSVVMMRGHDHRTSAPVLSSGATATSSPDVNPPESNNTLSAHNDLSYLESLTDKIANRVVSLLQPQPGQKASNTAFDEGPGECIDVFRNQDPFFVSGQSKFWSNLPPKIIEERRRSWKNFVNNTPDTPPSKYQFSGRGVITLAGNSDTYLRALTWVKMLKHFGCSLPIEVWYLEGEMNETMIETVKSIGATPRCASDASLPVPVRKEYENDRNFQLKTAVILNSSFREVLYMDSDNLPLKNVETLFDRPAYKAAGVVFWPDFWKTSPQSPIWKIMDVKCTDQWEQESGQILVDKYRHWKPLNLANYLAQANAFYFHILNGDKDTFRFAFLALNVTIAWPRRYMASVGIKLGDKIFCGHSMMQADIPTEEELLQIRGSNGPRITYEATQENIDSLLLGDLDHRPSYTFLHANLIKYFAQVSIEEKVWTTIKRYKVDSVPRLMPVFRMRYYPCTDLVNGDGEPEIMEEDFDKVFPNFNQLYYSLGGPGGSRTQEPPPENFDFEYGYVNPGGGGGASFEDDDYYENDGDNDNDNEDDEFESRPWESPQNESENQSEDDILRRENGVRDEEPQDDTAEDQFNEEDADKIWEIENRKAIAERVKEKVKQLKLHN